MALTIAIVLAWWLLPVLLEAAYAGTASPWLNQLIDGRDVHALEHYAVQLRLLLITGTMVTAPAAVLTGLWSFEPGRAAVIRASVALARAAPLLLSLLALSWLLFRILGSLQLPFFGDAAEKVVAAWMLSAGGRLYADVYANHGPLSYLLPHAVHALVGSTEMAPYRLAQWGLVGIGLAAVAASTALNGWRQRILATSLLAFVAATLHPEWKAHEPLYSTSVGLLVSIAWSLWLLPLLLGRSVPAGATAVGAAMIPCIIGSGYPYAVPVVLLAAGCALVLYARGLLRERLVDAVRPALTGIGVAALLLLGWIGAFADLLGYVAYHAYLNQVHYASIIGFDPTDGIRQIARLADPGFGWSLLVVLLMPLWLARARDNGGIRPPKLRPRLASDCGMLLIVLGMLYLNPRDEGGFKIATLQIPAATLLAIMLARVLAPMNRVAERAPLRTAGLVATLLAVTTVIGLAAFTPFAGPVSESHLEHRRQTARAEQAKARLVIDRVDDRIGPDKRIQVLTFLPRWYLLADRLPATGQHYYLPAQAAYERAPLWGHGTDFCNELEQRRVEVVLLHDYDLHGAYRLRDYAPCVARLLRTDYEVLYAPRSTPSVPMPLVLALKRP